jgi:hypothetical protein
LHNGSAEVSCDTIGLPKVPDAEMPFAMPKKAWDMLKMQKKPAASEKTTRSEKTCSPKKIVKKATISKKTAGDNKKVKKVKNVKKVKKASMKAASPKYKKAGMEAASPKYKKAGMKAASPKYTATGSPGRTGDFTIEQATLHTTRATAQSYICCFKKKKLIVAVTNNWTSKHKDMIEVLLKRCQKPGARKSDIVAARNAMRGKY